MALAIADIGHSALALVGCLAPRDWYDAIPRSADLPDPPIKGVTLLQISLVIEGLRDWSGSR